MFVISCTEVIEYSCWLVVADSGTGSIVVVVSLHSDAKIGKDERKVNGRVTSYWEVINVIDKSLDNRATVSVISTKGGNVFAGDEEILLIS